MVRRRRTPGRSGKLGAVALWLDFGQDGFVERLLPFFDFPKDIRRAIYTTNAIEALNRQLRKALKTKGALPGEDAAMKLLWLTLRQATARWSMPIKRWDLALQQFAIRFDGRVTV